MLQQPRVSPSGHRQAVEAHIKWRRETHAHTIGSLLSDCSSVSYTLPPLTAIPPPPPPATAMLQQPRVPPTGQRQAVEVHIKWREVLDYKRELLRCLSLVTGWGVDKLDADMQRPLYMRPQVRK
jgi:hypothetical protein